ncbi:MAG: hypothetical protein GY810_01505 [Aureispira sp.]|nr:hypothetical protein [Aureispira sp.]
MPKLLDDLQTINESNYDSLKRRTKRHLLVSYLFSTGLWVYLQHSIWHYINVLVLYSFLHGFLISIIIMILIRITFLKEKNLKIQFLFLEKVKPVDTLFVGILKEAVVIGIANIIIVFLLWGIVHTIYNLEDDFYLVLVLLPIVSVLYHVLKFFAVDEVLANNLDNLKS